MNHARFSYAIVAVALPVSSPYHYAIPDHLRDLIGPGSCVRVPFGRREVVGCVVGLTDELPFDPARLKSVKALQVPDRVLSPSMLALLRWVADYYVYPQGEVIAAALPTALTIGDPMVVSLSAEGRQILHESAALAQDDHTLLKKLASVASLPWSRVSGEPSWVSAAFRARERGWIRFEWRHEGRSASRRYRLTDRPGEEDPALPGGTVQTGTVPTGTVATAIVETLGEAGAVDRVELEATLVSLGLSPGGLGKALRRLLSAGVIEEIEDWEVAEPVIGDPLFDPDRTLRGASDEPSLLTTAQRAAIDAVGDALEAGSFRPILLHGVTGSGKTEVYLKAVEMALSRGKGAIVLVPEIALTSQVLGQFRSRFGLRVGCLTSAMTARERLRTWEALLTGRARVAVGTRSAIFAPVRDLGLLIVDEEHDLSFKQQSGLRYHARDLAVVRARDSACVVLLGSATPSLESYANAQRGRYGSLALDKRVEQRPMPEVQILDMTRPEHRGFGESSLSAVLWEALRETLAQGDQAILLLNRRGYAPCVMCPGCSGSFRCLHCDIGLTFHQDRRILLCHYCGLSRSLPPACPHCGREGLELLGLGTQRLAEQIVGGLPEYGVGRLDRDSGLTWDRTRKVLADFRDGTLRVLVGTQRVVKGHDFPGVTLVGVLNADQALNLPDFRASERTFQLITQVAGRAGRGDRPGRVIVQSHTVRHPSVLFASRHDFAGFFAYEVKIRRAYRYPPFCRLALVQISALEEANAAAVASRLSDAFKHAAQRVGDSTLEVLGPAPAPRGRIQRWFRWQVVVKAAQVQSLQGLLREPPVWTILQGAGPDVRVSVDIDPQDVL